MNDLANTKSGIRELREHDNFLAELRMKMINTNDCILDQNEMLAQAVMTVG